MAIGNELVYLRNAAATQGFGAKLAEFCKYLAGLSPSYEESSEENEENQENVVKLNGPILINLIGDLGAGKTTLTQGFARALDISARVKSPTYTIVEHYSGPLALYHFDLYRLGHPEELFYLGIEDILSTPSVLIVEWPERGEGILPKPSITIELKSSSARFEATSRSSLNTEEQMLATSVDLTDGDTGHDNHDNPDDRDTNLLQGRTATVQLDFGSIKEQVHAKLHAQVNHFWFTSMR